MKKLEKALLEEVARYRAINNYAKNLMEQGDVPPTDPALAVPPPGDVPPPDAGLPPAGAPPMDAGAPPAGAPPVDDTEEIDITDLVNMTKSIKKDLDDNKSENTDVVSKMDTVFSKLNDLEQKLSQMDNVLNKIDELGNKVEGMKEKTPQEKLELRSLDINSLYPSAIRALNMGPETIVGQLRQDNTKAYLEDLQAKGKSFASAWEGMFGSIEYTAVMNKEIGTEIVIDWEDGTVDILSAAEVYQLIFESNQPFILSANGTIFTYEKEVNFSILALNWSIDKI